MIFPLRDLCSSAIPALQRRVPSAPTLQKLMEAVSRRLQFREDLFLTTTGSYIDFFERAELTMAGSSALVIRNLVDGLR